ncbi:MAG: glycoside hydrolase family 38 C-terminal domain-containing protein, partial [Thermoanaerobaculales bacterium]
MIDKALDVCDASAELPPRHRFVWTLPGWPMAQILYPGQDPARRKRVEEAIEQGRLVWHALPVSTHTESLDLEDLVRGLRFSSELSRKFGMPLARDAKMTDVPSHTWILPTVLKHAGVEFLHLGCNSASGSPKLPRLFWWEGPDGSRLLTMYEASGYGSGILPPKDWHHRTWLGLIHTGDNHGPPTADEVRKLLEKARRELPGVTVRMGRLSDFADAIREEKPELPVVRGDMPDTWIHGIMSMPVETQLARQLRQRTAALEALATLLRAWGVDVPDPAGTVAAAYEGTLMFGEHTWGYSMTPFGYHYGDDWSAKRSQGHYERLEKSWAEKGAWVRDAQAAVEPALARSMNMLGRAVHVDGPRIVVFNPLPWKRDAIVSVEVPSGRFPGLKDLATGTVVPVEIAGEAIRFVARDVPPMGYRTYVPADKRTTRDELMADHGASAIENRWYRVQLDPARGSIASIRDKRSGRELVEGQSSYGFGQYLYERFDADNIRRYFDEYLKHVPGWAPHFARGNMPPADQVPYTASSPGNFELRLRRSDVSVSAVMTAPAKSQGAESVSLQVTLYGDQPYVDLTWSIQNKRPDSWPEAGWLCLPLAVDKPVYRLGRLGSIVDPTRDAVPGSNFDLFCLTSGMTVRGSAGPCVGICPIDSPLVSIG